MNQALDSSMSYIHACTYLSYMHLQHACRTCTYTVDSSFHLSLSVDQVLSPQVVTDRSHELLNRITGQGLQVTYRFSRKPHLSSDKMLAVKLTFQNTLDTPLSAITIGDSRLEVHILYLPVKSIRVHLVPGSKMAY